MLDSIRSIPTELLIFAGAILLSFLTVLALLTKRMFDEW